MLKEKLCQIGLGEVEAKIYLELLAIGPQPASVIAKRLKLNRTSAYAFLKSLLRKGFMSTSTQKGMHLFVPNDPNCLIGYVDRQCRTFEYFRDDILRVIPKFRALRGNFDFQSPSVLNFEGIEGVKTVLEKALTAENEFLTYYPFDKWIALDPSFESYLLAYRDRRLALNLKMKAIVPDIPTARKFFAENYENDDLTEVCFVKRENCPHLLETDINIHGDMVSILHLEKDSPYAVLITSPELANMQRVIFDLVWKSFKKK